MGNKIQNNRFSKSLFGALAVFSVLLAVKNLIVVMGQAVPALYEYTSRLKFTAIMGTTALFFAGVVWAWIKLRNAPARPMPAPLTHPGKPERVRRYALILFAAALALNLAFTFIVRPPAVSDFKSFYDVTNQIAGHRTSYLGKRYFQVWPYQTGFPAFMAPAAMLFPKNLDALLVVNNLFGAGTVLCLFHLLKHALPVRRAFFLSLGFLLLPYPYTVAAVYTNQLPAAFFLYLGLYLVVSKTPFDLKRCAAGALCASAGHMLRPEGILLFGAVLALMPVLLFVRDKAGIKGRPVLPLALFCAVYLAMNLLLSQTFVLTGLNPGGLRNQFPLYKFAVGLNEESAGQYTKADADDLFRGYDEPAVRDQYARELISRRLSVGPGRLSSLFFRKLDALWTDQTKNFPAIGAFTEDSEIHILVKNVQARTLKNVTALADGLWFTLLFALCAFTAVRAFMVREVPAALPLLAAFLLVSILAFSAVEVQRRYAYLLMPCIWLLAAMTRVPDCREAAIRNKIFDRGRGPRWGKWEGTENDRENKKPFRVGQSPRPMRRRVGDDPVSDFGRDRRRTVGRPAGQSVDHHLS